MDEYSIKTIFIICAHLSQFWDEVPGYEPQRSQSCHVWMAKTQPNNVRFDGKQENLHNAQTASCLN